MLNAIRTGERDVDNTVRYAEKRGIQQWLADKYAQYGEHIGCYRRQCYVCGKAFFAGMPHAELCSERCNQAATLQRRKALRIAERYRVCQRCGKDFLAARKDAKYCSAACRQRAYRERSATLVSGEIPR